jgi:hypothetical protein
MLLDGVWWQLDILIVSFIYNEQEIAAMNAIAAML